jgi:phage baseplate assembly protein W
MNLNLINPIGLTIPIQNGNNGFFNSSYDTLTQIKNNIINLLNTRQGERRFQPTFGTRLWNITFEQNVDTLQDISENIIREDISMWIPNVTILNVTTTLYTSDKIVADQDIYKLDIAIQFQVSMTKQIDTVNISINNTTT